MKEARSIDTNPEVDAVFEHEIAPCFVEQRRIGVNALGDREPGGGEFRDQCDHRSVIVRLHHQRFAGMPDDVHAFPDPT